MYVKSEPCEVECIQESGACTKFVSSDYGAFEYVLYVSGTTYFWY